MCTYGLHVFHFCHQFFQLMVIIISGSLYRKYWCTSMHAQCLHIWSCLLFQNLSSESLCVLSTSTKSDKFYSFSSHISYTFTNTSVIVSERSIFPNLCTSSYTEKNLGIETTPPELFKSKHRFNLFWSSFYSFIYYYLIIFD